MTKAEWVRKFANVAHKLAKLDDELDSFFDEDIAGGFSPAIHLFAADAAVGLYRTVAKFKKAKAHIDEYEEAL